MPLHPNGTQDKLKYNYNTGYYLFRWYSIFWYGPFPGDLDIWHKWPSSGCCWQLYLCRELTTNTTTALLFFNHSEDQLLVSGEFSNKLQQKMFSASWKRSPRHQNSTHVNKHRVSTQVESLTVCLKQSLSSRVSVSALAMTGTMFTTLLSRLMNSTSRGLRLEEGGTTGL